MSMEINDRKSSSIKVGKIITLTVRPRIKAVTVRIEFKNGATTDAYYEFGAFCFPIGGLLEPEMNIETPKYGKPEIGDLVAFSFEPDWVRVTRLDDMKTLQGRRAASDADIEFEKTERGKITAICMFRDWRNIQNQIASRPVFRIYQTADAPNEEYLFEGTMHELEAEGVEALWSDLLTVKVFCRRDWVLTEGDPREAYKAKKLARELRPMEQHSHHHQQKNHDANGREQTVTAA